jgi:CHAT domain-containing protein
MQHQGWSTQSALRILLALILYGSRPAKSEIIPTTGKGSTGTSVACSTSANCVIGGGRSNPTALFHRLDKFVADKSIQNVLFRNGENQSVIVAVVRGATIWEAPISLEHKANLTWISPGGIQIRDSGGVANIGSLLLTTGTHVRFGDRWFNYLNTIPDEHPDWQLQPELKRSSIQIDQSLLSRVGQTPQGITTSPGTSLSIDGGMLVDAALGDLTINVSLVMSNTTAESQTASVGLYGRSVRIEDSDLRAEGGNIRIAAGSNITGKDLRSKSLRFQIEAENVAMDSALIEAPRGLIEISAAKLLSDTNSTYTVSPSSLADVYGPGLGYVVGNVSETIPGAIVLRVSDAAGVLKTKGTRLDGSTNVKDFTGIDWTLVQQKQLGADIGILSSGNLAIDGVNIRVDSDTSHAGAIGIYAVKGVSILDSTFVANGLQGSGDISIYSEGGISISRLDAFANTDGIRAYRDIDGTLMQNPEYPYPFAGGEIKIINLSPLEGMAIADSKLEARYDYQTLVADLPNNAPQYIDPLDFGDTDTAPDESSRISLESTSPITIQSATVNTSSASGFGGSVSIASLARVSIFDSLIQANTGGTAESQPTYFNGSLSPLGKAGSIDLLGNQIQLINTDLVAESTNGLDEFLFSGKVTLHGTTSVSTDSGSRISVRGTGEGLGGSILVSSKQIIESQSTTFDLRSDVANGDGSLTFVSDGDIRLRDLSFQVSDQQVPASDSPPLITRAISTNGGSITLEGVTPALSQIVSATAEQLDSGSLDEQASQAYYEGFALQDETKWRFSQAESQLSDVSNQKYFTNTDTDTNTPVDHFKELASRDDTDLIIIDQGGGVFEVQIIGLLSGGEQAGVTQETVVFDLSKRADLLRFSSLVGNGMASLLAGDLAYLQNQTLLPDASGRTAKTEAMVASVQQLSAAEAEASFREGEQKSLGDLEKRFALSGSQYKVPSMAEMSTSLSKAAELVRAAWSQRMGPVTQTEKALAAQQKSPTTNKLSRTLISDQLQRYKPAILRLSVSSATRDVTQSDSLLVDSVLISGDQDVKAWRATVRKDALMKTLKDLYTYASGEATTPLATSSTEVLAAVFGELGEFLTNGSITSLVISADPLFINVPLALVPIGGEMLGRQVSLTVTPSLSISNLSESAANLSGSPRVDQMTTVLAGAQRFTNGLAPLAMVPIELSQISKSIGSATVYQDQDFTASRLVEAFNNNQVNRIHLATHAETSLAGEGKAEIFTASGVISLTDLSQKLNRSTASPLDLLTLSACRSGLGFRSEELGLAGAAIQLGARTTIGSTWYVDDAATAALFILFYRNLALGYPKAESLRLAQMQMQSEVKLNGANVVDAEGNTILDGLSREQQLRYSQGFSHPYFWSGMKLIGSPW